jgi:hypothetical protein
VYSDKTRDHLLFQFDIGRSADGLKARSPLVVDYSESSAKAQVGNDL